MSEGFHLYAHSPASLNGKSIFSFAEFDQERAQLIQYIVGILSRSINSLAFLKLAHVSKSQIINTAIANQ